MKGLNKTQVPSLKAGERLKFLKSKIINPKSN
jgi:hypothetical protein